MSNYIDANCREWHRSAFEHFAKNTPRQWRYVDLDASLMAVLAAMAPRYVFSPLEQLGSNGGF